MTASASASASWEAGPGGGDRVVVHVFKRGLLSALAHDHHFEVTHWRATAEIADGRPASASVQVVLFADSLRDRQDRLSEKDLREVESRAAGPEGLDAQHHPEIAFRSERLELDGGGAERVRGKLHGRLAAAGGEAPVTLDFEAERGAGAWRVRAKGRVRQTALGIKPFSGLGGTIAVKDEVEIEVALTLRPR